MKTIHCVFGISNEEGKQLLGIFETYAKAIDFTNDIDYPYDNIEIEPWELK